MIKLERMDNDLDKRVMDVLGDAGFVSLESTVGQRVIIADPKFCKVFVGTIASAEFCPRPMDMGGDFVRWIVAGVPHESGVPTIELHRDAHGKDTWKVAFGGFGDATANKILIEFGRTLDP